MKFLLFIKKAYRTFFSVARHLPDVIKEVKDLTGKTRVLILDLKEIWDL